MKETQSQKLFNRLLKNAPIRGLLRVRRSIRLITQLRLLPLRGFLPRLLAALLGRLKWSQSAVCHNLVTLFPRRSLFSPNRLPLKLPTVHASNARNYQNANWKQSLERWTADRLSGNGQRFCCCGRSEVCANLVRLNSFDISCHRRASAACVNLSGPRSSGAGGFYRLPVRKLAVFCDAEHG